MRLFLLDYGAGNVQSLANSLTKLQFSFEWIKSSSDFDHATHVIFPGVGAFRSAMDNLNAKGLVQPLLAYIRSGRPYFGICIGMQVLFESSLENPDTKGLGLIPHPIAQFSNEKKSVPHMGWNAVELLDETEDATGIGENSFYYFVHSYMAHYDTSSKAAEWAHAACQYGDEVFIATVKKDNIYACQFHPEKSGKAGLELIRSWLSSSETPAPSRPRRPREVLTRPKDGLTKRVIACLDVRANDAGDLVVTKGDQYDVREKATEKAGESLKAQTGGAVRNLGKPVELCAEYYAAGADEICLLNITSFRNSPLNDQPMLAVVRAAAEQVFVPLTIGGGIKDSVDPDGTPRSALEVAGAYFRAGADKVSIGSEAVVVVEQILKGALAPNAGFRPETAIESISRVYGRQAVVVSIDPKRVYVDATAYDGIYEAELVHGAGEEEGKTWWYQCTISGGREARPVSVVQLAQGVEKLGAGEILVNSIDRDGSGKGFDQDLVRIVQNAVKIPVVASSGAGHANHFVEVFQNTDVEAALAAGIFHRKEVTIQEVKETLQRSGIKARIVS